jgi:hypothetical protein
LQTRLLLLVENNLPGGLMQHDGRLDGIQRRPQLLLGVVQRKDDRNRNVESNTLARRTPAF